MKSKLILIILSAILIAPALSEDREFRRGLHTREVPGWKGRPYDLYIPAQYDPAKPWPVVLALHGGGGNSEHARKLTCPDGDLNSPKCLDALADREGFLVVYPNGTPNNSFLPKFRAWNATGGVNDKYRCIGGTACMENVDDIGYFRDLFDDLSGVANIDQSRIYATGISNGGAMAHRLACELSERIAAIASVAAGNQYEAVRGCKSGRPVPVLEIHGLKDQQWPYGGGYGKPVFGKPRLAESKEYKKLMVSIHQSMANWAKRNRCASNPKVESSGNITKEIFTGCEDNGDVIHYIIQDAGHTWPQGYQYFDESSVGKTSQGINANEVIWEFFKKHPKNSGISSYGPGDHSFILQYGALARKYLAHIPSSYDGKTKMPVIIAFHGGGGNPKLVDKEFGGMNAKADKEGFIAVYPYGHKCVDVPGKNMYCWNADSIFRLEFVNYNVDDVGFVSAMIEKLSQDFTIDEKRVYATGHSNGAWMAYAVACGLSDKIAAIAPIAGGLALESCAPLRPVSIIHFHGTADPGWPYYGGGSCWTDSIRPPISKTLSKWRDINQCSAVSEPTYQKGDTSCETFSCDNSEITFCTIKDGGHTVPGGYNFPVEKLMPWDEDCALGTYGRGVGKVSQDINALDAMWKFFKNHPKASAGGSAEVFGQGDYDFSFQHGGLIRTYKVHIPPAYNGKTPAPVVLYIHGGGGNARSAYLDKMDQASDKFGFILAVPEATGEVKFGELRGAWNGGAWPGGSCCGDADDVGFVSAMIERLKKDFNIDERRVYAVGISNGGLMTNRLGCELADKIAAIAAVAPTAVPDNCRPSRPLPVMDIHGTADTINPFNGSEPSNAFGRKMDYKRMPPEQVVERWLGINGCANEPLITQINSKVTYSTYSKCISGSEVVFAKVDGMGHAWPGGFESKLLGIWPVSYDISFDNMWDFLKTHRIDK